MKKKKQQQQKNKQKKKHEEEFLETNTLKKPKHTSLRDPLFCCS